MVANMILNASLISLILYQSEAFSVLYRNQLTKKMHSTELFETSATTTMDTYRSKTNGSKRGDEAKLFYQNPKEMNLWIEDEEVKVEDYPLINTSSEDDYLKSISKMKSLAQAGRSVVEKIRNTAALLEYDDICYINDLNTNECHDNIKKKYEVALKKAKDADITHGLCSQESLNAWDNVDEIYMKLENKYGGNQVIEEESNSLNDILEACNLLETAFMNLHEKMN